ncbi:E3 ubiquitin-protein ligase MARCH2-like protein [Leptotrombidium deliense]|uniref:E3 ubiquitin-protein ligase MARCH2-like protein n=1 Tax=Leptotrombidium deliense TaxID=299467 RepID=A0A443SPA0_9ACAR|nr:E3 ubiquitin-protein ligase MARCH2-like protein [Leptotrombidium deliense]
MEVKKSVKTPDSINFCRICHERTPIRGLIAPCRCQGTITFVHQKCLNHWLTTAQTSKCELCGASYICIQELRSFGEFCREFPRQLFVDIFLMLLLTPLPLIATFLCFRESENWKDNFEVSLGLAALVSFLYLVYFAWLVITIRRHFKCFYEWRTANPNLRIVWPQRPTNEVKKESLSSIEEDVFTIDCSLIDSSTPTQSTESRIAMRSISSSFSINS